MLFSIVARLIKRKNESELQIISYLERVAIIIAEPLGNHAPVPVLRPQGKMTGDART